MPPSKFLDVKVIEIKEIRGVTISGGTFNDVAGGMTTYDYHRGSASTDYYKGGNENNITNEGTVYGQMYHGGTYDSSPHTYVGGGVNNIKNTSTGVVNGQMYYHGDYHGDRVGGRADTRYNTSESHRRRSSSSHATQHRKDNSHRKHRARKTYVITQSMPPSNDGPNPYSEAPYGQRQDASSQSSYPMDYGSPVSYPRYALQPPTSSHAPHPLPTPHAPYSSPYANRPSAYASSSYPPSPSQDSLCSSLLCF